MRKLATKSLLSAPVAVISLSLAILLACGQSFDDIRELRTLVVSVLDLGEFELASSTFEQPLRLSPQVALNFPSDLGSAGSVTLLMQPTESLTQEHLFTVEVEQESNNSASGAQALPTTTVQVDGNISDSDAGSTVDGSTAEDFFSLSHGTTESRVAMLTSQLTTADFELLVLDAPGTTVLADSRSDEDGSSNESELVEYAAVAGETRLFAIDKVSSDSIDVGYHLSHWQLVMEVEPNDTTATAQSLNATGDLFHAIDGAAAAVDVGSSVSIEGDSKTVEDFYRVTVPRNALVAFALQMTSKPLLGDLDLYVVRSDTNELLGSSTIDQSSSSANVESFTVLLPADVEVFIFVDAVSGLSDYLLGIQVISEAFVTKPLLLLSGFEDPDEVPLFALSSECTSASFASADCKVQDNGLFSKLNEFSNVLNQSVGLDALSLLLPNNDVSFPLDDDKIVVAGDYGALFSGVYLDNATVDSEHTLTSEVKALVKKDNDINFGLLNINLYFVGNTVVDAATSESGVQRVDEILAGIDTIYAQVGIELGEVKRFNLTTAAADSLGIDFELTDAESITLLFENIQREEGVMNIFLVESFSIPGVVGLSLGIPGLPVVEGFPTSAAIFAMLTPIDQQSGTELNILKRIIAHEIGHYLGLYHPTESDGEEFDPLTDTAQCGTENDANGDGFVTHSECTDKGAENLMFWVLPDNNNDINNIDGITLSEQQGFVMQVNHYVR